MKNLQTNIYKGLTQGVALDFLKICAALLMLIDHIDHLWLDRSEPLMMMIGRGAYPLFAFAAAAAVFRTESKNAYRIATRLIILALLVEPISQITRDIGALNVLFTLGIGTLLIPALALLSPQKKHLIFYGAILICPVMQNYWEFGILGALLPAALYFMMQGEKGAVLWSLFCASLMNFETLLSIQLNSLTTTLIILTAICTVLIPWFLAQIALSLPQRHGSHPQARLMPKYFLHIFYPAHLCLLALLRLFVV